MYGPGAIGIPEFIRPALASSSKGEKKYSIHSIQSRETKASPPFRYLYIPTGVSRPFRSSRATAARRPRINSQSRLSCHRLFPPPRSSLPICRVFPEFPPLFFDIFLLLNAGPGDGRRRFLLSGGGDLSMWRSRRRREEEHLRRCCRRRLPFDRKVPLLSGKGEFVSALLATSFAPIPFLLASLNLAGISSSPWTRGRRSFSSLPAHSCSAPSVALQLQP